MTRLLLRLFVKEYRNPKQPAVRSAIGKTAGITGIICNFFLFCIKLAAGIMAGSVSVFADAANNLSDSAASVLTLLGFRMAQRPADKDHPYGHARYEYLSGLAIAVFVLLLGAEMASSSVKRIINPTEVQFSTLALVILGAAILIKLWMFLFYRRLGKMTDSLSLAASAVDSRNDVLTTSAVLAGCLLRKYFDVNIDAYIGLGVSLFILYSGLILVRDTVSPLLGKQADAQLVEDITRIVLSDPKVLGVHDLLVHDYGPDKRFASIHVEVSAAETPLDSHEIIDRIERDVQTRLNVNMVIHYDPVVTDDEEWQDMRRRAEEIIRDINPRFSLHGFRIVNDKSASVLVFDLDVPYGTKYSAADISAQIETALQAQGKKYATLIRFEGKE
ncbi:MAG: cation transporter [Ruminococcaceae bacterium]|nr:cation transporter [Oscillospiraceae bacterium]